MIDWDLAGECQEPRSSEIHARPEGNLGPIPFDIDDRPDPHKLRWYGWDGTQAQPLTLRLTTRCRKCDRCRSLRSAQWRARAVTEFRNAFRNWMCTLTVSPERRTVVLATCRKEFQKSGLDFDCEPLDIQLAAMHKVCNREITLAIKRLRERNPHFRYLFVMEQHKDGFPHYHALFHETDAEAPLRKDAHLRSFWAWGFSKWKLCDSNPAAATYVAKYLAKSTAARVRASVRYGSPPDTVLPALTRLERSMHRGLNLVAKIPSARQVSEKRNVNEPDPKNNEPKSPEAARCRAGASLVLD